MSPSGKQTQITLLQERSGGTFARVYLAEARDGDGLSRIVAVKVLKKQWSESEDVLARVRDEARLLARLRHKNILRVEALSQVDGQPALVMEFVDGVDLKQLIEHLKHQKRALPRRAAYAIARDTASALEGAYFKAPFGQKESLQVVHRDVKPSNIMVSVEGEVKVLEAARLMEVSERHTWRLLAAYRRDGAAASWSRLPSRVSCQTTSRNRRW